MPAYGKRVYSLSKIYYFDGKRLTPCSSVKYLGVYIDQHLNWNVHLSELKPKLSRAVGMLSKIRYYVNKETLRMVYFGIFSSLLTYGVQIWGQHNAITKKLQVLQNKAIRIMHFQPPRTSATPLLKISSIIKVNDIVDLQNFIFIYDNLKGLLPKALTGKLQYVEHTHDTRLLSCHQLSRPRTNTLTYGSKGIKNSAIDIWNSINRSHHTEIKFLDKSRNICKSFVTRLLLSKY